jgi:hypothetical protein
MSTTQLGATLMIVVKPVSPADNVKVTLMLNAATTPRPRSSICLRTNICAAIVLLVVTAFSPGVSGAGSGPNLEQACRSFTPSRLANGAVLTQVRVQPGWAQLKPVCVVRGNVVTSPTSTISFRIDLPASSEWNGKLLVLGGGGFDGVIPSDYPPDYYSPDVLKSAGPYVVASSDGGHQGRGATPYLEYSWVTDNPSALRNYADLANHIVNEVTVGIAKAFYGKAPARRYLMGGSNGGRNGLAATQRHPEDYDGVVSLAPWIGRAGYASNVAPEVLQHIFASPDNWINVEQTKLYEQAELDVCDQLDGLKDGILSNPAACHYDPAPLECKNGERNSNTCLTRGQIESIRRIFRDHHVDVPLMQLPGYPGYGRGAESTDWPQYLFGSSFVARDGWTDMLIDNVIKYGIENDPNASFAMHRPTEWKEKYRELSTVLDTTDPDLTAYYQRGGKLIVWHGVGDNCVSYQETARYVDSVVKTMGSVTTDQFLRFFTSPSVGHAGEGPGAASINWLAALEDWVEKGYAPDVLIAKKYADIGSIESRGKRPATDLLATAQYYQARPVHFSRPVCRYPSYPRYKGSGDPNTASSFVCTLSE